VTTIWDEELAALDFETTGLSPDHGDRVIEIAVVRGRWGEAPRTWCTLVHPCRPVSATHIHGITDDMVTTAPTFGRVARTLLDALDGALMTAHNARFEQAFLRMECARAEIAVGVEDSLDTVGLSRRVLMLPSNTLTAVCEHLGVSRGQAHRALDDAAATWRIAWEILDRADPEHRMTRSEAVAASRRPGPQEHRRVKDALLAAIGLPEPVVIDYCGAPRPDAPNLGVLRTRRAISVKRVTTSHVEAFCHLRGEDRSFRLDRIRLV
jgi:DNA polymerase-3 subunit epsilon